MNRELKEHRKKLGITQECLSKKTGINIRTLQDYEQGRSPLSGAAASSVFRLCRVFGISLVSDAEILIGERIVEEE